MTITTEKPRQGVIMLAEENAVTGSRDWMPKGACASIYAETRVDNWFGPDDEDEDYGDGNKAKEYQGAAKRACLVCPVRMECLDYAMRNDIPFGVWGGMTRRERNKLKKQRAAREAGE